MKTQAFHGLRKVQERLGDNRKLEDLTWSHALLGSMYLPSLVYLENTLWILGCKTGIKSIVLYYFSKTGTREKDCEQKVNHVVRESWKD